jgi:aminoglycoside phosphotransferase (APT) family kinase protein
MVEEQYAEPWRGPVASSLRADRVRAMTSSDAFIAAVVDEACGAPVRTRVRITEGFSNEVYAIDTTAGQQVIVRIHWYQRTPHFEAERWALDRCAAIGLPVPRLLLLRHLPVGNELHSVCVETRLPGQTLYSLLMTGALRPAEAQPVLTEVGQLLARLHTMPAAGFGRIDATGTGTASDARYEATPEMWQATATLGLARAAVAEAIQLLQEAEEFRHAPAPRLLHGDISPQQILVDAGTVGGLIDFEFPESGDPAAELAYWDFFQRERLPVRWLLAGYAREQPTTPAFARRLALWRLRLGLDKASYHAVRDDQDPILLAYIRQSILLDLAALRHP